MLLSYAGTSPLIGQSVFIAANATVLGAVTIGDFSSIWYGAVVRGDVGTIHIGTRTNIQDLSMIHVTGDRHNTWIGDDVTVGHRAILHGCTLGNRTLIGMGAILLDGAVIGDNCLIGAGTLVAPRTKIPSGSLVLGSPGKVVRPLTDTERNGLVQSSETYIRLAKEHHSSVLECP